MDEPKIITATEASRQFSDLLHRVCYGGESFIIKKGQRIMAQISPAGQPVQQPAAKPTRKSIKSENQISIPEVTAEPETYDSSNAVEYFKAMLDEISKQPA